MEWSPAPHSKCWLWSLTSLLWVKQIYEWYKRFKRHREDVEADHDQKGCWWWLISWLLPNDFFGCFNHETCVSKVCSETAEFRLKTPSDPICWTIQKRLRFFETSHNCWRNMASKSQPNAINESNLERKNSTRFKGAWK